MRWEFLLRLCARLRSCLSCSCYGVATRGYSDPPRCCGSHSCSRLVHLRGLCTQRELNANVILWQELSSIGFAWTLSFFQLAMSTVTLLALVGLGLSCKFTADEWRARIAARELENSACESRVRSYLVGRGLNPLQVDVVTGIVQGMTSAQIADALSYSAGSINTARLVAYRLLEVHNRAQLVELLARETGLADMYESIVA